MRRITRAIDGISSLLILIQFFLGIIGILRIRAFNLLSYLFATSHVRCTARSKKAATRKINTVLENAHKLMPKIASKHSGLPIKDEIMMNFVNRGESFEECGRLIWTWMRLLSGALLNDDGIASYLMVIQTVQLILFAFTTYFCFLESRNRKRWERPERL